MDNLKKYPWSKVLIATVNGMDNKALRTLSDDMKSKLADGIVILASVYTADGEDKIAMTASVGKHLTSKIKAGDIIKHLSENLGGKGGGKPDFAQGGCNRRGEPAKADDWLDRLDWGEIGLNFIHSVF